jgi:hypothetical protein
MMKLSHRPGLVHGPPKSLFPLHLHPSIIIMIMIKPHLSDFQITHDLS